MLEPGLERALRAQAQDLDAHLDQGLKGRNQKSCPRVTGFATGNSFRGEIKGEKNAPGRPCWEFFRKESLTVRKFLEPESLPKYQAFFPGQQTVGSRWRSQARGSRADAKL
jgi:hypothetical protein